MVRVRFKAVSRAFSVAIAVNANGTRYSTADHLGSPRVLTNSGAAVVSRHDYLPFGEELGAGVGRRTVGMGFSVADGLRQKFTSYERDSESSLDYAGARFYSSSQGRFTSADPLMASAVIADPQTLNRYSYVTNSPLTLIDPSGMFGISLVGGCVNGGGIPLVTLTGETPQQAGPPPPGGPFSPGPLVIDVGPVPLPVGEEPWPTTIEVVYSDNKTYNGEPLISPSGVVIDPMPNYGVGRTVDYIIRDQVGNPMSEGVLLTETVSPDNAQAREIMKLVDVQQQPQRPENGIVPDTLGFISRDRRVVSFLQQNVLDATFKQTVKVHGTFGAEYRTALTLTNVYQSRNSGVTVGTSTIEQQRRPK